MFKNMKLKTKLLTLGILLTAVPLLIIFVTVLMQNSRMAQVAAEESSKIASDDLNHLVKGIYMTCEARHEAVLEHTKAGLNIARDVIARTGDVSFAEDTVSWDAVNQYTNVSSKISLPKMIVGGTWLGQNADRDKISPVVDSIREIAGGTCTIFQRMNEAGDMLRVSTNVIKKDGTRAIGTFIPAVNPDGKQNPVISAVLKGRTYTGRAYVVDGWYITAYEPVYDINKRITGILYVGFPQDAGNRIRESIINTSIGETGYVYVLDSKGRYIISKDGKRDGEDIWEAKDADGNYFIQEMCRKAVGSQEGDIVEQRYAWKNAGDRMAYFKIARIMYFKPWDWVIGAGAYEREVFAAKEKVTRLGERSTSVLSLVFGLSLLAAILIWYFVARGIAGKIGMVLNHLTIASDQTNAASNQISYASQSLAEGASEQASSLEETSASIEEMASMTQHNADNAHQADSLMREAGQVVQRANQSMSELTISMKDISKASKETSKIVKTIDEIAFQTNLLALNAAVEAARAGEQGAGFAVVADEVRNLAMRSAEAAKNTSELIEGTVRSISGGSEIVTRTNEAFTEMISNISKVEELVSEIAAGSREHSQAIEQISRAIIEMDKVTQQNAASAEESASSTEELNAQAEEMKSLVYKLAELVGNDSNIRSKGDRLNRKTEKAGERLPRGIHKAISAPQEKTGAKKAPVVIRSEGKISPDDIIPMNEEDLMDF